VSTTAVPDTTARKNTVRLAVAQAMAGANSTVIYATGGIIGHAMAPDKSLSTLPITILVIGMAASTLPAGMISRHFGRRTTFLIGTGCGFLVGVIGTAAILLNSFWLYCVGTFFGGAYAAVVLSFRFAATDGVELHLRARALSAVMLGGVFAGVLGPQLIDATMDLWSPYLFAGTYAAQAAVAIINAVVLFGVKLPKPTAVEIHGGRPLAEIARQTKFMVAVLCGVVSYMLMNLVMTAAPLAMRLNGLSAHSSNLGIQWHVIAMYGPSFVTGRLITRFGSPRIILSGLMLTACSAAVGLIGVDIMHFWVTLILLGLGWNFGFLGASALVLECHRPEERTKVQSFNDFLVFGTMVVGSFVSGDLLTSYGWNMVCLVTLPPIILAVLVLLIARPAPQQVTDTA
jgi:MFS family permease